MLCIPEFQNENCTKELQKVIEGVTFKINQILTELPEEGKLIGGREM